MKDNQPCHYHLIKLLSEISTPTEDPKTQSYQIACRRRNHLRIFPFLFMKFTIEDTDYHRSLSQLEDSSSVYLGSTVVLKIYLHRLK